MSKVKRQNRNGNGNGNRDTNLFSTSLAVPDPTTEKLQTMGMRIRKAVADGYMLPKEHQQQPNTIYLTDYERQHIQNLRSTVLNQQQPPALSFNLSTASSLSDWESHSTNQQIQSLPSQSYSYGKKRSYDEKDNGISEKPKELNDFVNQYGAISFNEDF